jgi:signal transduction histidine kinase
MKESIIVGVLQNTAILFAFSLVYDYWWVKIDGPKNVINKILTGLVIGSIGIILMLTPWMLVPGLVFDTRSVMLSVTGLFFGFTPTFTAIIITGIFRLSLGGGGVGMGIAVIASSGAIGIFCNKIRPLWKRKNYILELVAMGIIVHLVMLCCTVFLPSDQKLNTLKTIIVPVLAIYPIATVLLGVLMFRQYRNWQNRKASEKLLESEQELIKAKVKAEESDKLKSIFLANMSHEIRTPMNAIMGFSNLLGEPGLDESEKAQYLDIIKSSGSRLLQLINDILDLSKIEAKQLTMSNSVCSLHDIFNISIESFRRSDLLLKKPEIELILMLPEDYKKIKFISDYNRIQQVLDNLISNAIKYTERGIIETGSTLVTVDETECIEFYVKDSGIGISDEAAGLVFERFRQVEEGQYHEGTGLGLSISKGIVELLGGKIWFVSKENSGSTFYFTVPYTPAEVPQDKVQATRELWPSLEGKKIIIAEDDYNSFHFLRLLLTSQNAIILHAENGKILFDMIQDGPPDLILLDMNMPVMSGFEFLSEIQNAGIKIKIIAQTAYAMPEEKERCINAGCNGYISKPIKKAELFSVINTVLSDN